jgi:hypothetical protein
MNAENPEQADRHKAAKEREIAILRLKLAVSAFFALPLLYIAMGAMLRLPLPEAIHASTIRCDTPFFSWDSSFPSVAAGIGSTPSASRRSTDAVNIVPTWIRLIAMERPLRGLQHIFRL